MQSCDPYPRQKQTPKQSNIHAEKLKAKQSKKKLDEIELCKLKVLISLFHTLH